MQSSQKQSSIDKQSDSNISDQLLSRLNIYALKKIYLLTLIPLAFKEICKQDQESNHRQDQQYFIFYFRSFGNRLGFVLFLVDGGVDDSDRKGKNQTVESPFQYIDYFDHDYYDLQINSESFILIILKIIFKRMEYTQKVLYQLPLPQILISFKNTCLNLIVPSLQNLINFMETPSATQSYVFILTFILLFLFLKTFFSCFFSGSKGKVMKSSQQQTSNELQLFKKQLENIKTTIKKLVNSPQYQSLNEKSGDQLNYQQKQSIMDLLSMKKLIQSYREAVQENQNLSLFIIQSHENLLKEIKKLKKMKTFSDRSPSNNSNRSFQPFLQKIEEPTSNGKKYQEEEFKEEVVNEQKIDVDTEERLVKEVRNARIPAPTKSGGRKNVPPPVRKL